MLRTFVMVPQFLTEMIVMMSTFLGLFLEYGRDLVQNLGFFLRVNNGLILGFGVAKQQGLFG